MDPRAGGLCAAVVLIEVRQRFLGAAECRLSSGGWWRVLWWFLPSNLYSASAGAAFSCRVIFSFQLACVCLRGTSERRQKLCLLSSRFQFASLQAVTDAGGRVRGLRTSQAQTGMPCQTLFQIGWTRPGVRLLLGLARIRIRLRALASLLLGRIVPVLSVLWRRGVVGDFLPWRSRLRMPSCRRREVQRGGSLLRSHFDLFFDSTWAGCSGDCQVCFLV